MGEDDIFELVHKLSQTKVESVVQLWKKVRFGQLSPKSLAAAAKLKEIPHGFFAYLLAGKALGPHEPDWFEEDIMQPPDDDFKELGDWLGAHHFVPRACFGSEPGLRVQYLYSVKDSEEGKSFLAENSCGRELRHVVRHGQWSSTNVHPSVAHHPLFGFLSGSTRPECIIMANMRDLPAERHIDSMTRDICRNQLGVVLLCASSCFDFEPITARVTVDHQESITLEERGTLCLAVPHHPLFYNFDPRGYVPPRLTSSHSDSFRVRQGSRVLATWSNCKTPEIIESSDSRVLTFVNFDSATHGWNEQMCHILRNAVAYVTRNPLSSGS